MIKQYPLQIPFFVAKFKQHNELKDKLLAILDNHSHTTTDDGFAHITRSDWYVSPGTPREYWGLLFPYMAEHIKELMEIVGTKDYKFTNYWFAQYEKNDYLNWHRHEGSGWSSVYYVKLDDPATGTLLKDPISGKIIQPVVEEGDILTFPGIIYHSSPVITSNSKKTMVAFNIS